MRIGRGIRTNVTLGVLLGANVSACADQRSQLVGPLPPASAVCPATLRERLSVTRIDVDADVGYLERAYDGFPRRSRIELSAAPGGGSLVAWQTSDHAAIHVTPLTADQARAGDDVVVDALELAGLVAHDDGFALLVRQPDPGQPLAVDPTDMGTQAAVLLRYRGGAEAFSLLLTGTASPQPSLDYSSALDGQLAWNGTRYGAYFAVHAGMGSAMQGVWGDQLHYVDDQGDILSGGWSWGCSLDAGLRLLAEASGPFSAACLSDNSPQTGLNWMTEGAMQHLAFEESWSGYTAGAFGSIVPVSDGSHLVVWASRGDGGLASGASGAAGVHDRAQDAPDLALVQVDADGTPRGPLTWLTSTPKVPEFTVHAAPYGQGRYLVIWSTLESCQYDVGNCYGPFGGVFARLIDTEGNPLGADEELPAGPTDEANLVVFPNGDVGWAFVDATADYTTRLDDPASVPAQRTLSVARLRACP